MTFSEVVLAVAAGVLLRDAIRTTFLGSISIYRSKPGRVFEEQPTLLSRLWTCIVGFL